jgi:hypothetical protein
MYLASWLLFEILLATASWRLDLAFDEINAQPIDPPINPTLHGCWRVAALIPRTALYSLPVAYFMNVGTLGWSLYLKVNVLSAL